MRPSPPPSSRARPVLALLAATLALGMVLLVAFEPDVQTATAPDLVERRDDARAFLIADYFFIALYAVVSPIVIWRYGNALGDGSVPGWIKLTALLLVAAGLVDATENALLLSATDSVSEDTVDAAHALEIPKIALFSAGALLAVAVNVRAFKSLRGPDEGAA